MMEKKPKVVCFGGEDWWYHNRGHIDMQLMKRFARMNTTLYICSIIMQKPRLSQKKFFEKLFRKIKSMLKGLKKSKAGFWVYSPFSLPLHHIYWARWLNEQLLTSQVSWVTRKLSMDKPVVWVACPAACDIAIKMKKEKLIYQRTDAYELYPNVDSETIKNYDQKLKANADLTIFVNSTLYDKESNQCRKAIYLDHGVDYERFARAEKISWVPEDIAEIKKPIVGFFGSINGSNTINVELIERVADLLPQMSIVLIGKLESDCSTLLSKKNVRMLGQKPYEQIPHYGKSFDVTIMPWRQNRWIEACNPIKLKEYLALGKPIVSTPFNELKKYRDVIYEATTPEEFADCIKKALVEDNPERIAERRKKVQTSTWDSKAELVLDELFGKSCEDSNGQA
jgi:glycosyltransferase involved in cell wall biosynthesis